MMMASLSLWHASDTGTTKAIDEQKEKLMDWLRENTNKSDRQMVKAMSHKLLDYAHKIDTLRALDIED